MEPISNSVSGVTAVAKRDLRSVRADGERPVSVGETERRRAAGRAPSPTGPPRRSPTRPRHRSRRQRSGGNTFSLVRSADGALEDDLTARWSGHPAPTSKRVIWRSAPEPTSSHVSSSPKPSCRNCSKRQSATRGLRGELFDADAGASSTRGRTRGTSSSEAPPLDVRPTRPSRRHGVARGAVLVAHVS